jgi:hypothetical protein
MDAKFYQNIKNIVIFGADDNINTMFAYNKTKIF